MAWDLPKVLAAVSFQRALSKAAPVLMHVSSKISAVGLFLYLSTRVLTNAVWSLPRPRSG